MPASLSSARVRKERATTNQRRLNRLLWLTAVVHLAHVVVIANAPVLDEMGLLWRTRIVQGHAVMGVLSPVLWGMLYRARGRAREEAWVTAVANVVTVGYLLFGAWLAGVDQLVTTNVTPLVVTGFGVALTLRIAARVATVAYLAQLALALIMFTVWLGPGRAEAVSSNLVNAVSIAALGWAVSRVLERSREKDLERQLFIEEQTRALEQANRDLERANRDLARLAETDALTSLFNRRAFFSRGARILQDARARGVPVSLILIDADHFKRVNDTFGHAAGDMVLRAVAETAQDTVRTDDLVARLGGEEFAVLLPGSALEQAAAVAESLRDAIGLMQLESDARPVQVTISCGVTTFSSLDEESISTALRRADDALYAAKRGGRDQVITG